MTKASQDRRLYDKLIELKRHLRSCDRCLPAKKARAPKLMCAQGMQLTLDAAMGYDDVIRLRVAAANRSDGLIFACPDPKSHGISYALTAPAYVASGIQDALF